MKRLNLNKYYCKSFYLISFLDEIVCLIFKVSDSYFLDSPPVSGLYINKKIKIIIECICYIFEGSFVPFFFLITFLWTKLKQLCGWN